MSLDDRLRRGFEHATKGGPSSADAALASVVAAYHAHKRRRAVLLIAAAIATTIVAINGDRAVRWVEGLERRQPPAHQDRYAPEVERDSKSSAERVTAPDGRTDATRGGRASRSARATDPTKDGASSGTRSNERDRSGGAVAASDRSDPPATGPSDEGGSSDDAPELSRYKTKKWSRPLDGGEPPPIMFRTRGSEHYVQVRLDGTGGGGTSQVAGEIYEIVNGESRLLEVFCEDTTLIEVEPRTQIEVRVSTEGCSGTDTWLKGTATADFYS